MPQCCSKLRYIIFCAAEPNDIINSNKKITQLSESVETRTELRGGIDTRISVLIIAQHWQIAVLLVLLLFCQPSSIQVGRETFVAMDSDG